jgi:uncharacterized spore protein YtfJ
MTTETMLNPPDTAPTSPDTRTTRMDVGEMLTGARDAISVRRVFGDPIERDGVTIVPAANVRGGGGGGAGTGPQADDGTSTGTGSGGGFGVAARPAGAFVLHGGTVVWQPAIDRQRIVLATMALAAVIVLSIRSVFIRR